MRKSRCQEWRRREGCRPETLHGRPALPWPQAVKPPRSSHQSRVIDEGHHCAERSPLHMRTSCGCRSPPQPASLPLSSPTCGLELRGMSQRRGRLRRKHPALQHSIVRAEGGLGLQASLTARLHRRDHPHRASPKTHISPKHLQSAPNERGPAEVGSPTRPRSGLLRVPRQPRGPRNEGRGGEPRPAPPLPVARTF
uniref:Uncharacterized protein n=1 Tax=Pipistrellus kuhlii TaxID=59472 RepID=A0A7J7QWQ2_PIPKU|nr:hypothetical protein mPipKuh1_008233 [Pipistrellus kuhlii]